MLRSCTSPKAVPAVAASNAISAITMDGEGRRMTSPLRCRELTNAATNFKRRLRRESRPTLMRSRPEPRSRARVGNVTGAPPTFKRRLFASLALPWCGRVLNRILARVGESAAEPVTSSDGCPANLVLPGRPTSRLLLVASPPRVSGVVALSSSETHAAHARCSPLRVATRTACAAPRVNLYRAREPHDLPGSCRPGYDQNSSQA
jgi:hypothetical protein